MGGTHGAKSSKSLVVFEVVGLSAIWWSAAVVVTMGIRAVVKPGGLFPHSLLFTGVLNGCVALWSLLLAAGYRLITRQLVPALTGRDIGILFFFGLLQGVEHGLTSKAASLLSVSTNRMVMASCVLFQLLSAVCWGLERIGPIKWAAGTLLVMGGLLENLECAGSPSGWYGALCGPHGAPRPASEVRNSWFGVALIVASVLVSSNRWALTQHVFQRYPPQAALRRLTKIQMLPFMAPGQALVCLGLASALEWEAFALLPSAAGELFTPTLIVSAAIMILMVSELLIVHITAATIMVILAVVHNIPIVMAGHIFNHDVIFRNQLLGFSMCTVGAAVYFYARAQEDELFSKDPPDTPLLAPPSKIA
eukprot:TRINITY_DN20193_c0_g1_i1.p1 TRINITY_DN20193_c0_g1~~TRINITY_DN20193_c0_g1_i1.p1  ORF type:complete len:364 (-),score=49.15 TRINITY_DN20193_c0_g1_i1:88-1179(-)